MQLCVVHVSLPLILNNVQVLCCLTCVRLSRYLSVLIIEVRLKSQQQRDSFRRVTTLLHVITFAPSVATPQLHSQARLVYKQDLLFLLVYFFSCVCLVILLFVLCVGDHIMQAPVVKVTSDTQRDVCKHLIYL